MTGLLKNNFYASIANAKIFSIVMVVWGIAVVYLDNDSRTLLLAYLLISMVGFPANAIASLRKEYGSKCCKYKLTFPLKRKEIVGSYFLSQLVWLMVGILFAGVCVSLSIFIHGFPFDRNTDVLMVFTIGISMSLFMGTVFYPLFYLGGEERNEVIFILSLLCAVVIIAGVATAINCVLGTKPTTSEVIIGAIIILCLSVITFVVSYLLTVNIFRKKEF